MEGPVLILEYPAEGIKQSPPLLVCAVKSPESVLESPMDWTAQKTPKIWPEPGKKSPCVWILACFLSHLCMRVLVHVLPPEWHQRPLASTTKERAPPLHERLQSRARKGKGGAGAAGG